jgi:hypothetical protein
VKTLHKCEQCLNGNHKACHGIDNVSDNWPVETFCGCRCQTASMHRRHARAEAVAYRQHWLNLPQNAALGRYVQEAPMTPVSDQ